MFRFRPKPASLSLFFGVLFFLAVPPGFTQSEAELQRTIERLAAGDLSPSTMPLSERNKLLVLLAKRLMSAEGRPISAEAEGDPAAPLVGPQGEDPKAMFREVHRLVSILDVDGAEAQAKRLVALFPQAADDLRYKKWRAEMAVFGKKAGTLQVSRWFQDRADFETFPLTLVVFWETWCPHCQDEMPKMEAFYQKYQDRGFGVIGLTKVKKPATNTDVVGFIVGKDLSFPVGKDEGDISTYFGVTGVPAAVLIKAGVVIWRGNPVHVNDTMIEKALAD